MQVDAHSRDLRQFGAQGLNNLIHRLLALVPWNQADKNNTGVAGCDSSACAGGGHQLLDIRIACNYSSNRLLMFNHRLIRNPLGRFGESEYLSGIRSGQKAFRNQAEQVNGGNEHEGSANQHKAASPQDPAQRSAVKINRANEYPF